MEEYLPNGTVNVPYDPSCAAKCANGTFVGRERDGVVSFRGIPFAAPPVGPLRWKEPVPVPPSDGVFEALHNGPSAIQSRLESEKASFYKQSEDCLYLNVWTAAGYAGEKRSVMVFIHGGNYGWGGTADPLYDGHNFVSAHPEIVLVTIAYRVGLMGFVDFSEVPGGEAYASSGNLGLLDQICALRYLRENVASFGGDPENVTLFGESAGGGSVSLLPLMPAAKGLFSRVIAQSGSVALTYSRSECLPLTRLLLKETGAKRMEDLLSLSESQLMAANDKLDGMNNFPERDGVLLPEDLYAAYEEGDVAPVDLLYGTNADELRYWILDIGDLFVYRVMSRLLYRDTVEKFSPEEQKRCADFLRIQASKGVKGRTWQYTEFFNELLFRLPAIRQGEAHAARGNRVYQYYWEYPSAHPHLGACHAVELAYVFNNLQETIYTGERPDETLAKQVQAMWVAFARTGDPSIDGVTWEPFSADERFTMILHRPLRTEKDWRAEEHACLSPLLAHRLNGNSTTMSIGNEPFGKAGAFFSSVGETVKERLTRT